MRNNIILYSENFSLNNNKNKSNNFSSFISYKLLNDFVTIKCPILKVHILNKYSLPYHRTPLMQWSLYKYKCL